MLNGKSECSEGENGTMEKKTREQIEFFCPHCKKIVPYSETGGGTGGVRPGILKTQEWPKISRYHFKCNEQVVELRKKH